MPLDHSSSLCVYSSTIQNCVCDVYYYPPLTLSDQRVLRGYVTSARLQFNDDEEKYDMFEIKILAHLRLQKLHDVVQDGDSTQATNAAKNADVFAELVHCLDDKSLQLIMQDAKDDGKAALKILRNHYCGSN